MRITCPACAAEYEVPESLLAGGPRLLRCARCGHQFEAGLAAAAGGPSSPPAPPPMPAPEAVPEPDVAAAEEEPPRPPPSRGPMRSMPIDPPLPRPEDRPVTSPYLVAIGWALSAMVLLLAGLGAYIFRLEIIEAWPPAARLFVALGLV